MCLKAMLDKALAAWLFLFVTVVQRAHSKRTCPNTFVKIFVYDIPHQYNQGALEALSGMHGDVLSSDSSFSHQLFEVVLHRWLLSSGCCVSDPEDANLFFIPVYAYAYAKTRRLQEVQKGFQDLHTLIDRQGRTARFAGADHFVVCNWNNYQYFGRFLRITKDIEQLRDCLPETRTQDCYWKSILVPYVVNNPAILNASKAQDEEQLRSVLVSFRGSSSVNDLRVRLKELLAPTSDVIYEEIVDRYNPGLSGVPDLYHKSIFCAVPRGDTANSKRFYDALFCGCIPVVLSDKAQFPFPHAINYEDIILHLPEKVVQRGTMLDELRAIPSQTVDALRRNLAKAREQLEFVSNDVNPGGFVNLLMELETRRLPLVAFEPFARQAV